MDPSKVTFILRALVKSALGMQDHAQLLQARDILDEEEADDELSPDQATERRGRRGRAEDDKS
jgi:hypothetical protein